MTGEQNAYGKKSYEYAIGRIKATNHPVLTGEQWSRLREADYQGAVKLIEEYGYPRVEEGGSVRQSIDSEMERAVEFILELAPDQELTNLLFFLVKNLVHTKFKEFLLVLSQILLILNLMMALFV
jgi:hypothetical protein